MRPLGKTDYKVYINPEVAFTVVYEDKQGRLLFCVEPGDDPNSVNLNLGPSEGIRIAEGWDRATRMRHNEAVERVILYFEERGTKVQLDG